MTQGSVLALWSHSDPHANEKEYQETVNLVREGEDKSKNIRDWQGPLNILSWKHVETVMGRDYRFEFRHCEKNVCITTADLTSLRKGDHIWVGNALLVVIQNGFDCPKRCHMEPGETEPCILAGNWIVAEVLREGSVRVDDPLISSLN